MLNKSVMAGWIALLVWTGLARAQNGLGGPVPMENPADAAAYPDCKVRPYRPILNLLAGNRLPARTNPFLPAAHPSEGPAHDEVTRMVSDGGFSQAEITAAKVRNDELQAKSRQAAVKYLATVDCLYYPEAESSLIAALRADRSESVRLEAATSLRSCRGVTVRILDALYLAATAQETDGNPAESSERVRSTARASLNHLLSIGMSAGGVDVAPVSATRPPWAMPPIAFAPPPIAFVPPPHAYNPPIQVPARPPEPASQREREIAATVSVQAMSAAPTPPHATLYDFWMNLISSRERTAAPSGADPRLRGMAPLGSEPQLAIPKN